jgi:8-oxo-dGTP pyrophosphatase MutT (NUDIX family)
VTRPWRALKRSAFRLAAKAIALYNRAFHPHVHGASVIVRVGERILIVHSTYQRSWSLPGGRVKRGEAPLAAARRELAEETGIAAGALTPLGELVVAHSNVHDHVAFFGLELPQEPPLRCDGAEIAEARFATRAELARLPLWPPLAVWLARERTPEANLSGQIPMASPKL